jgi:hypothetical protein
MRLVSVISAMTVLVYPPAPHTRLKGLDFDRIIYCNIGNPQQLQQKPITFFRQAIPSSLPHPTHITNTRAPPPQVLALVDYPQLIDHPTSPAIFPPDAISRAREILASEPGGTGKRVFFSQTALHAAVVFARFRVSSVLLF